jgi:hypothetical protein
MGTRSAIARINGEHGFKGTYHHWDGYPTGLGATLFNLYQTQFNHDLPKMLHVLIDEHPAGWSTINGKDFNLEAGYFETQHTDCTVCGKPDREHYSQYSKRKHYRVKPCNCGRCSPGIHWLGHAPQTAVIEDNRPQCYCHGERSEEGLTVDEKNASGSGVEYVYMFTENHKMMILSSYCGGGRKMIGMFGSGDPDASWSVIATVDLNDAEPNWEQIEQAA